VNPIRRIWTNAEWELRFPLFIGKDDELAAVLRPKPLKILGRVLRLMLQKLMPIPRTRRAVLTFDDGPYEGATQELLATLQRENVPATFFLVGNDAAKNLAATEALVVAGMEIASHSATHRRLTELNREEQREEIAGGRCLIERSSAASVRFFRPPHGDFDRTSLEEALASDQVVSLWNVNPADYDDISAQEIIDRVVDQRREPAVILLHTGRPETIKAIPEIVSRYRAMGFTFTTVGGLTGS
jgi:peptidoglycan/xylan/chitin deacetylase (PgdA/CDA1 family)